MTKISKEEFFKAYDKAPKKITDLLDNETTAQTIAEINKKYAVTGRAVADMVGDVLVGLLHPKYAIPQLQEELNIPNANEVANTIAKDVNEKIFTQVKDLLIDMYQLNKELPRAPEQQIAPPAYNTSPEVFEKKIQQSVLSVSSQNLSIPKPDADHLMVNKDTYRELP